MRKFRKVYKDNLPVLIEVLADNGCRVEIHRTPSPWKDDCYHNYYDVFILEEGKRR